MAISGDACRLCGGPTEPQFHCMVLGRHDVQYRRCASCGSLQTDPPTWLAEAYDACLATSDVGVVQRCLTSRTAVWWCLTVLGLGKARVLDFGGGTGLLCRLLRDLGMDAWTTDRYGRGDLARAFQVEADTLEPRRFDVVTAFEVFEHLPEPAVDLARLFDLEPRVVIASTVLYTPDCGPDWWYLAAGEGQHVFFYTRQALAGWAERRGYRLVSVGNWQIFVRQPVDGWRAALLSLVLRGRSLRATRLFLEALPSDGHVAADHRRSVR